MAYTGSSPTGSPATTQNNPLVPLSAITGQTGMPVFNVFNGVLFANINTPADGVYYLAITQAAFCISGIFFLGFTGAGRNHTLSFSCDAHSSDNTASLTVLNNNSLLNQDVFSNLSIVQDNVTGQQYLQVTVGNRNGNTGPLNISWYGNPNLAPGLAPAAPGANTPVPTYGTFLDTSGNYSVLNGNFNLDVAGNKLNIKTGTNASVGTSGAMTAGTVTVSTTAVTASSLFFFATHTLGTITLPASYYVDRASIVPGVSFIITSNQVTDTSTVDYWIIN